jgi:hypothetical protein
MYHAMDIRAIPTIRARKHAPLPVKAWDGPVMPHRARRPALPVINPPAPIPAGKPVMTQRAYQRVCIPAGTRVRNPVYHNHQ